MDIYACCRQAIADGAHNTATFKLVDRSGATFTCRWLDAYFDAFVIEGDKGFIRCCDVPEGYEVEDYSTEAT